MFFLLFSISYITVALGGQWCRYDCGSEVGNRYGNTNYGEYATVLPHFRTEGLTPVDFTNLCTEPTILSETNHPVVIEGESNPTFAVLCPEGVKIYRVNSLHLELISFLKETISTDSFLTANYQRVVLANENSVSQYELRNGDLILKNKLESGNGESTSAPGLITLSKLYAFFGTTMTVKDLLSGETSTFETSEENALGYHVLDGSGNVYFCSASFVVKVSRSGRVQKLNTLQEGFQCSHIIASRTDHVVIAGNHADGSSSLFEVSTPSFDSFTLIGSYAFTINGMSREAWKQGQNRVALLALLTNEGVVVVVERDDRAEKGAIYSRFNTTGNLIGRPTLTVNANPIVFDVDEAFAYTRTHLIKFFDTNYLDGLDDYDLQGFLPNPLYFSRRALVAFTTDGVAVLYSNCNRFEVGKAPPENACPIGELPPVAEIPFWMSYAVGAGGIVVVPFLGTYLLKKMKVIGKDEDVEEEEESEYESEEESDDDYLTPR